MKENQLRWIEAVAKLALDPSAKVLCPENLDAALEITDVVIDGEPKRIERHMVCPKCGAYNATLFRVDDHR